MMVAPSGTGKEAGGKAVTTLLSHVKRFVPNANFMGPSEIASGPALHKALAANPCFVSVFGEFGLTLQEMSSDDASSAQISFRKQLLNVFNKSGKNDELQPIVYSDKRNDTLPVESPALTLLCESSPEVFYDNLDEGMINGGLIPRFVLFEYNEFDAPYNPNHHLVDPSKHLIDKLNALALNTIRLSTTEFKVEELKAARKVVNIDITPDAMSMIEQFRLHTKEKRGVKEFTRNIWNRAHVTAWKIAGLCAIGENYLNPIIQVHNVLWACGIVDKSCSILVSKLESGHVGKNSTENKQELHIKRVIKEYLTKPFKAIAAYSNNERLHQAKIIPHSYISKRLGTIPVFMGDRLGKTNAIKRVISNMVAEDVIREVSRETMKNTYQTIQVSYVLQDLSIL